jgi:hypothetical protein
MTDPSVSARELESWLLEVSGPDWIWHAKYLSANDTTAKSNVHQAGPHIAKALLAAAFPVLSARADTEENPDLMLEARLDSHGEAHQVRLVWYNSKRLEERANGRDEARITRWGGADSALLEPDATGSLAVFAFHRAPGRDADGLRIWRCRSLAEEEYLLDRIGGVEPGRARILSPNGSELLPEEGGSCVLSDADIPPAWREAFPSGEAIVAWVVNRAGHHREHVDRRLIRRRDCEFDVFRSVERFHAMPRIREGFDSVDAFVEFAGSLTNRRKARSGRSLELQAKQIFDEESLAYSWTPQTEEHKTPDFIFPSIDRYHDSSWPAERLRMLAAKTTCKDRWRQILTEAGRIGVKHLLTLQEGISVAQHREMRQERVQLVVPAGLARSYPDEVIAELITLEQFIADTRSSCGSASES